MAQEKELTTGGSEVRRHDTPADDPSVAVGSEAAHEAIRAHFARHVGEATFVFGATVSSYVKVDVHFIPPGADRPWWTLFTTGMSDRPMVRPAGVEGPELAELMLRLPAGWKLDRDSLRDEAWYWPIRQLRFLASFPHAYGSWVGAGHTVANGDPPVPFACACPFSALLTLPAGLPPGADVVHPPGLPPVQLYSVYPITTAETEFKLEKGTDALVQAFAQAGVSDLVDIGRPGAVDPKQRWWQVF